MTCHLFLDNFSWNFMTFGWFQRLRVLKQIFVSRKLKYLDADIMKCSCFLNLVFSQKTFCCRKLIVFSCLQFADCYIWQRIFCLVVWFLCFNHFYGIFFWKVFLQEIMVLSKTCVRFRNRIFKRFERAYDQIIFFPITLGRRFHSPLWKKFEKFSILGVNFLFVSES